MKTRRLWLILVVLALLTPLGLWLPERLGAGDAWGEWSPEDLGEQIGFIPRELGRLAGLWRAPIPDYAPVGWEERSFGLKSGAYVTSALLGIGVCGLIIWALGRWLVRRERTRAA
jgi:hypothetical protein